MPASLHWLPADPKWNESVKALERGDPSWPALQALAKARVDFLQTTRLDRLLRRAFPAAPESLATRPVRLALLGSATVEHLAAGIRVALLRRGVWSEIYLPGYGQQQQELLDSGSGLAAFKPTHVLFAYDAPHLCAGAAVAADAGGAAEFLAAALARVRRDWARAQTLGAKVLHQMPLPTPVPLMGGNEHRLPGSGVAMLERIAAGLRDAADADSVDLVALDRVAARDGLATWHNTALYHRGKYEVAPDAGPMYGELVGRIVAAQQGLSRKCLVLDLDNTLWGGVIGDDGLQGIVLGQGNARGEAFAAMQTYARDLGRRGVILAVCSKNDEKNALEAFRAHPEMVLREADIACFVANWEDKATNLRAIAARLNIGLDSLVFLDDNPFERNLVRSELPMLEVPEVEDDPAAYPIALADAGYFEGLGVTGEDLARNAQYRANAVREAAKAEVTDMPAYLHSLEMRMPWRRFDEIGLPRIVQLINKTNQFNLTTRRYTAEEAAEVMVDPRSLGLQLRLVDRYGDNGMIAVVIGRMDQAEDLRIDTWLMSCRVLGRTVEETTLDLVAGQAAGMGAKGLVGEYRPTAKNGMVGTHYDRLGFTRIDEAPDGSVLYRLPLPRARTGERFIAVVDG